MKILVVHNQVGQIRSVIVPGRNLPFSEFQLRPAEGQFVTAVDADLPNGEEELTNAIQTIRDDFQLTIGSAKLVPKKRANKQRKSQGSPSKA
jgi:hypothetical protein